MVFFCSNLTSDVNVNANKRRNKNQMNRSWNMWSFALFACENRAEMKSKAAWKRSKVQTKGIKRHQVWSLISCMCAMCHHQSDNHLVSRRERNGTSNDSSETENAEIDTKIVLYTFSASAELVWFASFTAFIHPADGRCSTMTYHYICNVVDCRSGAFSFVGESSFTTSTRMFSTWLQRKWVQSKSKTKAAKKRFSPGKRLTRSEH